MSTASGTPAGSYPLTVKATSGALSHTVALTLNVSAAPPPPPPPTAAASDFSLSVVPGARIVRLSSFALVTVKTSNAAGPVPGVDLSVTGLPAGVTAGFSLVSPGVWHLRLDAAATAVRFATTTLTVTARLGSYVHTAPLVVTVITRPQRSTLRPCSIT